MIQFLLRRILWMIPTLLGITFVTFSIINFAPGDPVAASMGKSGGESGGADGGGGGQDKQVDAVKAKKKLLGMVEDDPVVRAWETANLIGPAALARAKDAGRPVDLTAAASQGGFPKFARTLTWNQATARLFVGSEAGAVHVVDPSGGAAQSTLATGAGDIWCTAVDDAGRVLGIGDTGGTFRTVATADGAPLGKVVQTDRPFRRAVAVKDGDAPAFLSACDDGVIRLHAIPSGEVVREYRAHSSYVAALAVSADGKRFWSGGYDRRVREWDVAGGPARVVAEAGQAVMALALSPSGSTLAAASEDRSIRLIDLRDAAKPQRVFEGHFKGVTAVTFDAPGATLWSGGRDGRVLAWDIEAGRATAATADDQGVVTAIVLAPDGTSVWTASESTRKTAIWRRYVKWLGRIVTFDFDRSFVTNEKVIDKIAESLPVTLGMNALALFITYLIAIPWGILAAVKRGKTFDRVSSVILFMLWSMPSFWVATMLIMTFSSKRSLDLFPSVGLESTSAAALAYLPWLKDRAAHLVLPLIVMTYGSFTGLTQYMRTSMLETISQDFVRTARAKGLPERLVVFKHALRNSLITMVTLLAGLLPGMIGGSLFVEIIFSIEGMGKLSYTAVLARDYPIIMAISTFTAFLTLLGVLLSDVLYSVVDPRIRHE
ncbi:MAG: ABC transporter permease subunit [Planctomycetes bacterium]|nr:ABC transporter permease subunit [Planctomycetota bacterium]